ncbi:hypothetical protein SNE40_014163 [Patella caerulea]|uniref:Uncharacterized protein n=1 Tax=Patella caerulea TaxID=87958 RepID=A0AAN8PSB0_PATCE
MAATRSKTDIFALGKVVTEDGGTLTGCRLPTAMQILRAAIFHTEDGRDENKIRYDAAKMFFKQVTKFYAERTILLSENCKTS